MHHIQGNVLRCAMGSYTIFRHIYCHPSKFLCWVAHWNLHTFDYCSWKIHYANRNGFFIIFIFRGQKFRILNSERLSSHEDRENSHDDVIYLEGAVMFPSGDVSLI